MPTARVREACGIPGTSVRTAFLCRDKPAMKEVLRAGRDRLRPVASASSSREEIRAFAASVGFPLIVKPPTAAGASGTRRAWTARRARAAHSERWGSIAGRSIAVEEFVEGHEGFYDTITIRGEVVHDFVSHYYPNVLEAMRARWISPQFIATNRIDSAADYAEVRAMGKKVIALLGIETSATHMEWFFGPKGLKFSEIGCRPPGVRAWDLYCAGNDMDLYREWAMAVVHGQAEPEARRAPTPPGSSICGPDRDGRILGYEGLARHRARVRPVDHRLPPPDPGHADAGRAEGLHGERLDPDAASRLRRAPPHARSRGRDGEGPRRVKREASKKTVWLLGPQYQTPFLKTSSRRSAFPRARSPRSPRAGRSARERTSSSIRISRGAPSTSSSTAGRTRVPRRPGARPRSPARCSDGSGP